MSGGKGNRKARATGGLVGVGLCVELHQKGEKSVRQDIRQLIEGSKLLADRRLNGAKTEGFVPSVVFTALRKIEQSARSSPDFRD
jgi:hypothetical protein